MNDNTDLVHGLAESYAFDGDTGYYTPTEAERAMLEDFGNTLLEIALADLDSDVRGLNVDKKDYVWEKMLAFKPQIVSTELGPEPSLEFIVKQYYRQHMPETQAVDVTRRYFDALRAAGSEVDKAASLPKPE